MNNQLYLSQADVGDYLYQVLNADSSHNVGTYEDLLLDDDAVYCDFAREYYNEDEGADHFDCNNNSDYL